MRSNSRPSLLFAFAALVLTSAETALPTSTTGGSSTVVDAKCVVETGSPIVNESSRASEVSSETPSRSEPRKR